MILQVGLLFGMLFCGVVFVVKQMHINACEERADKAEEALKIAKQENKRIKAMLDGEHYILEVKTIGYGEEENK